MIQGEMKMRATRSSPCFLRRLRYLAAGCETAVVGAATRSGPRIS